MTARGSTESSRALFAPGDLVLARFRVDRLLGKGGMAEVYRATDLASGDAVALKVVLPELLGNAKTRARFEREVAWTRGIRHPNVIRIDELIYLDPPPDRPSASPIPCLVMELLEGQSVADYLEHEGAMDCDEALEIVLQVAAALAAAHRAKVVHRDLKPDNIFLEPPNEVGGRPRVVLTDFGVARRSGKAGGSGWSGSWGGKANNGSRDSDISKDSLTASNLIIGTPEYMAPEVLDLEDAIASSDLYSLGLVFYEMVTGSRPFEDEQPLQALFKRVRHPAPSPLELRPDLDPQCVEVIMTCLERAPEDRYASAEDLIRAIDGDDSDHLGDASRFTPEQLVLAAAGAVMVVLVIVLVLVFAG